MSNTSSAISMRADDEEQVRRPAPWRALLVIGCLLAAALYGAVAWPPCVQQYRATQREELLSLASMAAAEAERSLREDPADDRTPLAEALTTLLQAEPDVAYVRVWNAALNPLAEATQRDPAHPLLGRGMLPELEIRHAVTPLQARLKQQGWIAPIASLQTLTTNQADLTTLLQRAIDAGHADAAAHNGFYVLQDDGLRLAETLAPRHPLLREALPAMAAVLDALTRNDSDALQAAVRASAEAEASLTYTLEDYRAVIDALPTLPGDLARHTATPDAWWEDYGPVRGSRVLVPLFTPVVTEVQLAHAGYAEVVTFDRPTALLGVLGGHLAVPAGLLLIAVLALCLRRCPQPSA